MYNLANLSPEEKDQLLEQLVAKYDGGAEAEGHPDQAADAEMLEPFAKVIEVLINKVEELEQRLMANEKLVVDDLFGGIEKLYKTNLRAQNVDGLKSKYGSMFDPHMEALKTLAPDEDVYESLHDMLEPLKATEGFNDEMEMGHVKSIADAIAEKIKKIKGEAPVAEVTEEKAPEGVAIEVTKTAATPITDENGADAELMKRVKAMKEKAKAKGF